jgi:hypothetical protein
MNRTDSGNVGYQFGINVSSYQEYATKQGEKVVVHILYPKLNHSWEAPHVHVDEHFATPQNL